MKRLHQRRLLCWAIYCATHYRIPFPIGYRPLSIRELNVTTVNPSYATN